MLKSLFATVATAAFATTAVAAAPTAKTTPAKPVVAKPAPAKAAAAKTAPRTGAMMAAHTTKSGKTINYDCSKAGNKNKTACKGK